MKDKHLDIELLGCLELNNINKKVEITLKHNYFSDRRTSIDINFSNLDTGVGIEVIYGSHPRYLLNQWNANKKRRLKIVRLADSFINKTLTSYLEKMNLEPELKNKFEEYKGDFYKKSKFRKGQQVICIRKTPWKQGEKELENQETCPNFLEVLKIKSVGFADFGDCIAFEKYPNLNFQSHNFNFWKNQKKYLKQIK